MECNDKAATVPKAEKNSKKRTGPQVIEEVIRKFLNDNRECKDYKPMQAYLRKQGIELTQPTISRYLKRLQAVKDADTGFWSLEKATAYERNLSELEKLFNDTRDVLPIFSPDVKVAVLKTKPHFNSLIAKKIHNTFVDEVVDVFCPNDAGIVILYHSRQDDPLFEKVLSGLCEKLAPQK